MKPGYTWERYLAYDMLASGSYSHEIIAALQAQEGNSGEAVEVLHWAERELYMWALCQQEAR